MTNTDEIIAEIRKHRETHAEAFDYDLDRITRDFQRQERESAREVVTRAPRKPQTVQGRLDHSA